MYLNIWTVDFLFCLGKIGVWSSLGSVLRERGKGLWPYQNVNSFHYFFRSLPLCRLRQSKSVCVCVCMCVVL